MRRLLYDSIYFNYKSKNKKSRNQKSFSSFEF